MTDPVLAALLVNPYHLIVIKYRLPAPAPVAPEPLALAPMQADIDKLITTLAFKYTDPSCMFLHTDDLESEGRCALVNVL